MCPHVHHEHATVSNDHSQTQTALNPVATCKFKYAHISCVIVFTVSRGSVYGKTAAYTVRVCKSNLLALCVFLSHSVCVSAGTVRGL